MKHHVITMAGRELKCRLTTQGITEVERKLGNKNILKVILEDQVPSLSVVLAILHQSLQPLEHGYTMEKVYKLYDDYVEEDKTYMDLVPEIIKVLEISGFFKKVEESEEE